MGRSWPPDCARLRGSATRTWCNCQRQDKLRRRDRKRPGVDRPRTSSRAIERAPFRCFPALASSLTRGSQTPSRASYGCVPIARRWLAQATGHLRASRSAGGGCLSTGARRAWAASSFGSSPPARVSSPKNGRSDKLGVGAYLRRERGRGRTIADARVQCLGSGVREFAAF